MKSEWFVKLLEIEEAGLVIKHLKIPRSWVKEMFSYRHPLQGPAYECCGRKFRTVDDQEVKY